MRCGRKTRSGSRRPPLPRAQFPGSASASWRFPAPAPAAAFSVVLPARSTAVTPPRPSSAWAAARPRSAHPFYSARGCGAAAPSETVLRPPYTRLFCAPSPEDVSLPKSGQENQQSYPILQVEAKSVDVGRNRGEPEVLFLLRLENDFSFDMSVLGRFLNVALLRLAFFSPRLRIEPGCG